MNQLMKSFWNRCFSPGRFYSRTNPLRRHGLQLEELENRIYLNGDLGFIEAEIDGQGGVNSLDWARASTVSPDGKHVYVCGGLSAFTGDNAITVFSRNNSSGELKFVEAQFDDDDTSDPGTADGLLGCVAVAISPDGKHVYTAAQNESEIGLFSRNAASGKLTFESVVKDGGGPVDGISGANALAITSDGKFLYATGLFDDAVAVFKRNESSGLLTFVELEKNNLAGVTGLDRPLSVTVSADGKHVYTAAGANNNFTGSDAVAAFSRDATTGQLTFIASYFEGAAQGGNTIDGLEGLTSVTVSPDGKHVYAAGGQEVGGDLDWIAIFSRDSASGALTWVDAIDYFNFCEFEAYIGYADTDILVSPDNERVYVTLGDFDIALFSRNTTTGDLTFVDGQCFLDDLSISIGSPGKISLDPSGRHLYVPAYSSAAIAAFRTDPNLFFTAQLAGGTQQELHVSDGSAAGTRLVRNLGGTASSAPKDLTQVGDMLFFTALVNGERELYKSNGTAAGTKLVKNLRGSVSSSPLELTAMDGKLYFTAIENGDRELYVSDGTPAGTVLVKDLAGTVSSNPKDLTAVGSTLFFSASLADGQRELHKSDGTAAGTVLVKDLSGSVSADPQQLTAVGNQLYFTALLSDGQRELYKSNGGGAGTGLVRNLSGATSSSPLQLTAVGNRLFFTAKLSNGHRELHTSVGSFASTVIVVDPPGNSNPTELTALGNRLFFTAQPTGGGRELYRTAGTAASTILVKNLPGDSRPQQLTAVDSELFFTAISGGKRELFKSDGSASGTKLVKRVAGAPLQLTSVLGTLFFTAEVSGQRELFSSEGTAATTKLVRNLSGSTSSNPTQLTFDESEAFNGALLAAGGPANAVFDGPALTATELDGIVSAAANIWAATGLKPAEVNRLRNLKFEITDLRGARLGFANMDTIKIDVNAAGYGWFVDDTPYDDDEFLRFAGPADGRMDLLTVVLHEMGHALGMEHQLANGLMHNRLAIGARLSP